LALQFHLETTAEGTALLVDNCGDELSPSPYVQSAVQMLSDMGRFDRINRLMASVLKALGE
jgi:hypothetical protein